MSVRMEEKEITTEIFLASGVGFNTPTPERIAEQANTLAYLFATGIGKRDQNMVLEKMPVGLRFYEYEETKK